MKKKKTKFLTLIALCALFVCCIGGGINKVFAETTEPEVCDVTVELSNSEIYLPQPKVYGKWNYKIDVYADGDTETADPLAEGVIKYRFTETGNYTLKYTFIAGGEEKIKTATLSVRDTTAPRLSAVLKPAASYKKGDVVEITVKATDNGIVSEVKVSISKNGKNVTDKVYPDGALSADKNGNYSVSFNAPDAGNYDIAFTVTDGESNETSLGFEFAVKGGLSGGAIAGISVGGVVLVGAVVAVTVFLLKKKEKKNGEK